MPAFARLSAAMGPCPGCHSGLCARAALSLLLLLASWSKVQGDCGRPPRVPFASFRGGTIKDSYPVGARLSYRCQTGYELIRGKIPVLICLQNSKWSDENPQFCQGKQCPVPVIENGDIDAPNGLRLGSQITYTCNHGFRVIGANSARCMVNADNTVGWSRPPPHCQRVICYPPPAVENGRHSGETKLDDFLFGDSVTYTCNKDYSLIGTATLSCVVAANGLEGAWSPNAPECKVVRCGRPTISNGRLTTPFQASYTYEHTVGFECNRGYTLVGSQTSTCGADNNWHPPVPTCVRGVVPTRATTVTTKATTTKAPIVPPDKGSSTTKSTSTISSTTSATETSTLQPEEEPTDEISGIEPGTTESSQTESPSKETDSGNSIAIAVGAVLASLLVICLLAAAWKYRNKINEKTEADAGPESSEI